MKIDVYTHFFPDGYFNKMIEIAGKHKDIGKRVRNIPCLVDLDVRFRFMDEFGDDYRQILSTAAPPPEEIASPEVAAELSQIGNDGMAELVERHPERFAGFVATMPMNNTEAACAEAERSVKQLKAVGVQIYTNVAGKPLDEPDFQPFFDTVAKLDCPIWMHPTRTAKLPDYLSEDRSKYEVWWTFGWPYETSTAMARMVFSGLFDRHPNLKIITHHMGGMVPYFEGRVGPGWDQLGARTSDEDYSGVLKSLKKPHLEYFKGFYADTALFGSAAGTRCGFEFFGADHVLFASDSPFDPEKGPAYIRETIRVIDGLDISDADRQKIYHGNAERMLKLRHKVTAAA